MPKLSLAATAWSALYLALWSGAYAFLSQGPSGEEALPVAVIFGLILPLLAWALTLGWRSEPIKVERPTVETFAIVGYLVIYATLFLGWGLGAVREWFPQNPTQEFAISGLKILAHLILPAVLLAFLGARLAPLVRAQANRPQFWLCLVLIGSALLALLAFISPSLQKIAELKLAAGDWLWAGPGTLIWLILSVGLCEEFLFRAVLQPRLTAFLKSATGAIVIGSILFGLAHAPGLYLRADPGEFGASPDPLMVIAYTIAVLSPTGIFFGVLWARTKSLWLLVLLHVAIDFLPNVPDFVQSFGSLFKG